MLDNVPMASRLSKGSLVSTQDNPLYYGYSGRKSMRITGVRITPEAWQLVSARDPSFWHKLYLDLTIASSVTLPSSPLASSPNPEVLP